MVGAAARSGGLFKLLRVQSSDVSAAAGWGVAAGTTALWLIQPFDWIKKQLFEKPQPEE